MRKLNPHIIINFEENQDDWANMTYEIKLKEKKIVSIKEVNIQKKIDRKKPIDSSTKLF